jgi:hypothetical protein
LIPHGVNCKSSKSQGLIFYFSLKKLVITRAMRGDIISYNLISKLKTHLHHFYYYYYYRLKKLCKKIYYAYFNKKIYILKVIQQYIANIDNLEARKRDINKRDGGERIKPYLNGFFFFFLKGFECLSYI